jgi:hypothetical protein
MRCYACDADVPDGAKFCHQCGTMIHAQPDPGLSPDADPPDETSAAAPQRSATSGFATTQRRNPTFRQSATSGKAAIRTAR